ncbi:MULTISPECIES: transglutaminase-like cysteine peptidase [Corallincola]|uniref:Sulfate adenylyltransferase n=2 Tax=Corallincola TaxID=1775176 RepID=A0A368NM95_9GAMM|nr:MULTISPECIES: transglutaminase-like cysteine peptidase [Corallincola]RCU51712.1 sulfate adenylyltransferase [Corallincola holothuriorum]TAA47209.1 sulfate adenylyltransferase [Corallincola spongiicola]
MRRYLFILLVAGGISLLWAAAPLDFSSLLAHLRQVYGEEAEARGKAWQSVIERSRSQPPLIQLKAINNFFNQMKFSSDESVWGVEDYWATPIEFIGRGEGDCEDYTIAKYYSLIEAGFPADKLRLMYVKAVEYNQHHMVLTYYEQRGAEPLVLDNIDPVIRPASERDDLIPIYSFNADFLWLAKARSSGQHVGKSDRISLWRDLQERHAQQAQKN